MIPRVEIMYNYDYAKRLYRGEANFEDVWRRIIGLGADFEKIMDEYIEPVMNSIEKYSGFRWAERETASFPVYLADVDSSFCHPFTLAVNADPEAMLKDFVYQLVHRNIFCGFIDDQLRDRSFRLVADYVMYDLNLSPRPDDAWNLNKKTIKEYLNK